MFVEELARIPQPKRSARPLTRLFHQLCRGECFGPFGPLRIFRFQLGQPSFEEHTLDSHQSLFFRVPECFGLLVIKHEGPFVSPSRRCDREPFPVNFAAVHSRQIDQRSVAGDDGFRSKKGVGRFVVTQFVDRIGMRVTISGHTDDAHPRSVLL